MQWWAYFNVKCNILENGASILLNSGATTYKAKFLHVENLHPELNKYVGNPWQAF